MKCDEADEITIWSIENNDESRGGFDESKLEFSNGLSGETGCRFFDRGSSLILQRLDSVSSGQNPLDGAVFDDRKSLIRVVFHEFFHCLRGEICRRHDFKGCNGRNGELLPAL